MSATRMVPIFLLVLSERKFVFSYTLSTWSPPGFEYRAALTIGNNNNYKTFIQSTCRVCIETFRTNT